MRTQSPRIRAPRRAARPERATAPARALTALALTLTACGADGALSNVDPPDDTRPTDRIPGIVSNLREDFINRELVETHGGVELDVNRGLVRLPTQTIPEIRGEALKSYATTVDENGVVTAAQILVENGAVLRASDAIELVATDLLRVSGEIRAGRGGLTLAAGKRLVIDGHIESEGPIHMAIGDEDGTIELTGTILAAATPEGLVPSITLSGRGTATIGGRVETVAMAGGTSGSVFAHLYGALVVGPWARVATLAEPGGIAGGIRLKSEREITLHEGASIGAASKIAGLAPEGAALAGTGDVELEADVIELGPRSAITGGDTLDVGGSIAITAGSSLTVHDGAIVRAGDGAEGGTLLVDARGAKLQPDALLSAGTGLDRAGLARLEIAGPLTLARGAVVRGGDGLCSPGGGLSVLVAGTAELPLGARLAGGDGGLLAGERACPTRLNRGGDVEVTARAVVGAADVAITPGAGYSPGDRRVTIDDAYEVAPPNLTVATRGWIESRTVDRGEDARGFAPRLEALQSATPPGTTVRLMIGEAAAADADVDEWHVVPTPGAEVDAIAGARWLRYRVVLEGRAFDTPVLDFFDVVLAPAR